MSQSPLPTAMPSPAASYRHVRAGDAIPDLVRNCVLAIGNFDGVHRGHQAVIAEVLALAAHLGAPAYALTFEPHPRTLFRPADPVFRLTPEAEKAQVFAACGLNGDIVREFDHAFAAMSADDFVDAVLIRGIGARHVVTGFDFHFGKDRKGSPAFLKAKGAGAGLGVTVVEAYGDEAGEAVSSSAIRHHLKLGALADATELLGYRPFFCGQVIHGEKRGRDLGYPTANLRLGAECGLRHGIYAVRMRVGEDRFDGVASFGRRPTFDNGAPLLETHLFDFSGDLYGKAVTVTLYAYLREERKFATAADLVARMEQDSAEARLALADQGPLTPIDRVLNFS